MARSTQTTTKEKLPEVANNMAVLSFCYSKKVIIRLSDFSYANYAETPVFYYVNLATAY